jgi:hypothetical protein
MSIGEYEYEPIRGLPGTLPAGESLLWQSSSRAWPLGRRALRIVPIACYFGLVALWQGISAYSSSHEWLPVTRIVGILLMLGTASVGTLALLGYLSARATVYSITSRRVVIRHGIALPMTLNIPLQLIDAAALKLHADGTGDLALCLRKGNRVGYLLTWPHVRPGHYAQPQPTLRAIDDAPRAAELLAAALRTCSEQPMSAVAAAEAVLPMAVASSPHSAAA